MHKHLKKITDLTINELLNNEIIMPSIYFEKFNSNAFKLNIDAKDTDLEKEFEQTITDEFSKIEQYMEEIYSKTDKLTDSILETKIAIENKDSNKLSNLYKEINDLQEELSLMKNQLYLDESSQTYNRKWIYKKFLDKEQKFQEKGIAVLINILDLDYVQKEYGTLLADNLVIFIIKKLKEILQEYHIHFHISRFTDNQLIFFIKSSNINEINSIFFDTQNSFDKMTLKSKSGFLLNGKITYSLEEYFKNQESKNVFENLYLQINCE